MFLLSDCLQVKTFILLIELPVGVERVGILPCNIICTGDCILEHKEITHLLFTQLNFP